jgi:DNA processing protein
LGAAGEWARAPKRHDRSAPMHDDGPVVPPRVGAEPGELPAVPAELPAVPAELPAVPAEAYATALASVPGIGPRTLRALLEKATPRSAWEALLTGNVQLPATRQSRQTDSVVGHARRADVAAIWSAHVRAGAGVCVLGQPGYPAVLAQDPEAPAVLFSLGNPRVLDAAPRVAIVGTRSATRYGLGVAAQLGADLAAAGVVVVSGLALGIDGAAHEGAVAAWRASRGEDADGDEDSDRGGPRSGPAAAPPVGVVAGNVGLPYPRQHAGLWRRVAEAGAVVSESPIGVADLAWRFPLRNRIIAAVSDVVVVVECHTRGGSLHTVQAATARGVPIGAVPGSVRSPASAGTNSLLADGCFVVRDASDVLVAVGLATVGAPALHPSPGAPRGARDGRRGGGGGVEAGELPSPTSDVLAALGWEPMSLDDVLERSRLAMDAVCGALERLRAIGLVHGEGGFWERV